MHGKRLHLVISLARPLKILFLCRRDSVIRKRPVRRVFFQFFLLKKKKRIETIIVIDNSSKDKNSGREKFKMSKQTAFAREIAKKRTELKADWISMIPWNIVWWNSFWMILSTIRPHASFIPHKVYNFQNLLTFKRGQDENLNFKSK